METIGNLAIFSAILRPHRAKVRALDGCTPGAAHFLLGRFSSSMSRMPLQYFVVFAKQALQWSISFRRPNFHCCGFSPLGNEILGLLIKVNIGTKRYREQLSNLL